LPDRHPIFNPTSICKHRPYPQVELSNMVQSINTCPPHWSPRCHPRPCDVPKPVEPAKPQPTATTTVHNVLYLVDEHDITGKPAGFVPARDFDTPTLRARYAWHHGVANLTTFNVPELPDTIKLHEMIGNPKLNKNFRWEGFMFGKHISHWKSLGELD
jgi:hypothetical protein